MLLFYNASGTLIKVVSDHVYQGSDGATTLYFIAPIPQTAIVNVAFTLPNGDRTAKHLLTLFSGELDGVNDANGNPFYIWAYDLDGNQTAYAGNLATQFFITLSGITRATEAVNIAVEHGVPPLTLPTEGDTYKELIAYVQDLIASFNSVAQSKQDALTETQLAAVNSGIDSEKVAKIGTNETAIEDINEKIPSNATSANKLVDTAQMQAFALPITTKYGANLSLAFNNANGQLTAQLKDQDGNNLGQAQTVEIDLQSPENTINNILALIPPQASASNQLADKNFVNSSISTNTAHFIGTFNSLAELEAYTGTVTNNDYANVIRTVDGQTYYDRYTYNAENEEWEFNFTVNSTSFTAVQWAALNSGITAAKVAEIDQKVNKTTTIAGIDLQDDITSEELKNALDVPQNFIDAGNGSLAQTNLSYNQMIEDFEPNMVAYVSYIGAGVSSPTSEQLIALLNSDKTNPYVAAILGNYTFEQYCQGFLAGTGSIQPGVLNKTAVDALIAQQLSERWGISSLDDLSNFFGAASDGAVGLGFKNKLYSPAAITFGFDNQAGDEGYPSESIGAIATGYNTKSLGNQSIATGFGTKALGNQSFAGGNQTTVEGEQSIAIGSGGECHIDGSTEDEKDFQRKYLTLLERAGGTVTGDGDSRIGLTGITKGSASQIFGHNLYNGSDYTTIIGNYNIADDGSPDTLITGLLNYAENSHRSLLYGYNNEVVNSSGAIAGGESNKITDCYAGLVSGYHNEANAPGQVIMGANNKGSSTKRYQVILGKWNAVSDDALLVVGDGTWEGGRFNLLEIYPDSVMVDGLVGSSKLQAGIGSKASGARTIAVGGNTIATGDEAAAFGTSVTASGASSIAMGRGCTSSGIASVALGYYVNASGQGQVAIGNFNDNVSSNIFEVGNGTDTWHRSNAFEIGQDGVARAYGTPVGNNDLTPKSYVDARVSANPAETGSTDLTKLKVGDTVYNIPSGGSSSNLYLHIVSISESAGSITFSGLTNSSLLINNYNKFEEYYQFLHFSYGNMYNGIVSTSWVDVSTIILNFQYTEQGVQVDSGIPYDLASFSDIVIEL